MARVVRTQSATGDSPATLMNHRGDRVGVSVQVAITGTATATVFFTLDAPTDFGSPAAYLANAVWQPHPNLTAITATTTANVAYPIMALKTNVSALSSGVVVTTMMQIGN